MDGIMAAQVQPYIDLIRAFVERKISAPEFEARYLALFKSAGHFDDEDAFNTLDRLFTDIDAYVSDADLRDSPEDLDDDQLHTCAIQALAKLTPRKPAE
jgi:hypothetical protein